MVTASCADDMLSSLVHIAINEIGIEVAIKQLMTAREELIKVNRLVDFVFIYVLVS